MRKVVLAAAVAFVVGGATAGSLMSYAQPPPPPPRPGMEGPGPGGPGGWWHHRHGPWMHKEGEHRPIAPFTFALVYPAPDRHLTPADVQTIAQAFLLWNGNHTWKVTDVAPAANGAIGFAYATADGSVIARFTMNPHTGRVTRTD